MTPNLRTLENMQAREDNYINYCSNIHGLFNERVMSLTSPVATLTRPYKGKS